MMLSWVSAVAMLEAEITSFDDTLAGSRMLRMFLVKTVNAQFYGIFPCSSVLCYFVALCLKNSEKNQITIKVDHTAYRINLQCRILIFIF